MSSSSGGGFSPSDMAAFREGQTRRTLMLERSRCLELHRSTVQELRLAVAQMESENALRRDKIRGEASALEEKREQQDAKLQAKEALIQDGRQRLHSAQCEVAKLEEALQATEAAIEKETAEIVRRQEMQSKVEKAREALQKLKWTAERKDAALLQFEGQVARGKAATEARYASVESALDRLSGKQQLYRRAGAAWRRRSSELAGGAALGGEEGAAAAAAEAMPEVAGPPPRLSKHVPGLLEGMGGESVLLVGEDDDM